MGYESEHFSEKELRCRCGCKKNGVTEELLVALEALRRLAGKPVKVHSAYRCREHNRRVNGAPHSQHLFGRAADISIQGMTAAELEAIASRIRIIGGIGRNDHKQYLHIDVRPRMARWCYDKQGKVCEYYKA